MIGENRQLVTNYRLSLRNNRLKLKTTGKLPIVLEEFIEYTQIKKRISTGYAQKSPRTLSQTSFHESPNLTQLPKESAQGWDLYVLICIHLG